MAEKKVVEGLKWVKGEIAATLRPLRDLIESAAHGEDVAPQVVTVIPALTQVQGVLLALQLPMAARLVQEMRLLLETLAQADDTNLTANATVLGAALMQLTAHLDRLDAGAQEPPLQLANSINAVRAAWNAPPLSTVELLTIALMFDSETALTTETLASLALTVRQVRPHYHRYLVEWYRGDSEYRILTTLGELFARLAEVPQANVFTDLFRLAQLLTEAVQYEQRAIDPLLRALLGHLDRVLKPLAQTPLQVPTQDALVLIEQFINLLDGMTFSAPPLTQLRTKYTLPKDASPHTSATAADNDHHSERLLTALHEFSQIKLQFNQLATQPEQSAQHALAEQLHQLANTLESVDGGELTRRLREFANELLALVVTEVEHNQAPLEDLAMKLLSLEATLHLSKEQRALSSEDAPAFDLSELTAATLREANYELLHVKDVILNWHVEQGTLDALASVRPHLLNVSGALTILGEYAAAQLADAIGTLVAQRYVATVNMPSAAEFEQLADALAALELFIGHLQDAVPFGDHLIAQGSRSLAALAATAAAVTSVAAEPKLTFDLPDTFDVADTNAAQAVELELPAELPAELTLPSDVSNTPSPTAVAANDNDDSEFIEIFMEEAREESASAQIQCARWQADPTDHNALGMLRRSFHTLKGSGRLVGALQIADFSQAFELLLNRVMEERVVPSVEVLNAVTEAVAQLPELLTAQVEQRSFAIQPFIDHATALLHSATLAAAAENDHAVAAVATAEVIDAVECTALPTNLADQVTDHDSMFIADEELLRIFQTETHEHLAELQSFLQRSAANEVRIDEATQRALHTLTGSARMAGIDSIAVVTKALEQCLKPTIAAGKAIEPPLLALLARAVEAIALRVNELPTLGQGAALLVELGVALEQRLDAESASPPLLVPESKTELPIDAAPARAVDEQFNHAISPSETRQPLLDDVLNDDVMPPPDAEAAGIFLEEARDLLDHLDTQFRAWQLTPQDIPALDGINRLLHTLKGGARLTGLVAIGDLSHALETRLKAASANHATVDDTTLELAQRAVDALSIQVDALEQGAAIPRMSQLVAALSGQHELLRDALPETEQSALPLTPQAVQHVLDAAATAVPAATQIRVRSELLNQLVNQAGEISIYRGRLSQRNSQFNFSLGELDQTVLRLSEQLRQLEIETQAQIMNRFDRQRESESSAYDNAFDPLELDRFSRLQQLSGSLAETVNDLVSVKDMLTGHQREFTDLLTQQARLADDLQDGLLRTRLVPFVQVVPRLQRLVRQTADSLGKQAQLEVKGPEVELDRTILDRLVAPLEHLLRNAVDHGLEEPETRVKNGKPAQGLVTLALAREGNDAVISLSDDGRGMNLQAIRRKAVSLGMLAEDTVLPDDALLQFILEPGFTTSEKVTQISGRGVGLDVVASEIKAANGAIGLESVAGQGARFTIRLPLTLAIIEAFLVSAGENIYAIPHSTVEAATRINRQTLLDIYRGDLADFTLRDQRYRVVYLGGVLDATQQPDLGERRWLPLLLIRLGEQRVALHVDSLIESQRILVKPLGPQLARVRWLSGGTILSDGRVALILDALALLRSGAVAGYRPNAASVTAVKPQICIMVVDDSLTVRRVTSRLLRRQNMEVLTAKDGVEALTLLDENRPDLLLLDVEMPRMDGYELARHIRRAEHLKDLPIIMITSRTSAKHREYAMALGVDRYLGKPYQESELLNEINSLLEEWANRRN
ncbi:hypothetical protein CKO09_08060 [Chromatium weissei]|nr:hypothetical protein [Chromatium weissei]